MISFISTFSLQSLVAYSQSKDSSRRVVTFIYSTMYFSHFFFTSLFTFRSQIFSFQFCKGQVSINVIRWKCNFGAVTIFRCGPKCPWMLYPEICFSLLKAHPWEGWTFLVWSIPLGTSQEEELQGSSWHGYNKTKNKYLEFPCLPDWCPRLLWITVRPLCCLTSSTHTTCSISPCIVGK